VNQTDRAKRLYRANVCQGYHRLTRDIPGLRRCKIGIINGDFFAALQSILEHLVPREDSRAYKAKSWPPKILAREWFENGKGNPGRHSAARIWVITCGGHERLDRMLAMAKVRRNKALRCIADYRQTLAKQVKQSTDRILDGDEVPRFVAVRKRSD
jgi:hypothetical protein